MLQKRLTFFSTKYICTLAFIVNESLTDDFVNKADDKIFVCNFSKNGKSKLIILRIQRLEGKQCRSR